MRATVRSVEATDTDHECRVVPAAAVAVELDPVVEQALDVVQGVRPVLMAGKLDRAPDLFVGRSLLGAIELALELLELASTAWRRRAG